MRRSVIDELTEAERKATAGPWKRCGADNCKCPLVWAPDGNHVVLPNSPDMNDPEEAETALPVEQRVANTNLIALMRNALPELIAAARERDALKLERDEAIRRAAAAEAPAPPTQTPTVARGWVEGRPRRCP